MPKILKYCKREHNLAESASTLQLGTFDHYRDLDPAFSIADPKEGFLRYEVVEDGIHITADQFNSLTGGAIAITDQTTVGKPQIKHFGSTNIKLKGGEFVGGENGVDVLLGKDSEIELYYPNTYIFCTSVIDDNEDPNPKSVSEEYDSYYEIKPKSIGDFAKVIASQLESQLCLGDIKIEGAVADGSPRTLGQPMQILIFHRKVEYVEEKEIKLRTTEDVNANKFYEIYIDTIFKKESKYRDDREYRFVFFVNHSIHGLLSMKKQPKVLEINPLGIHLR